MTAGWTWTGRRRPPGAEEPGPGQESVWDFPRPPRLETVERRVRVEHAGVVVADTRRAFRVVETAGAPVYYLPPADVRTDLLERASGSSRCEWKGLAVYHDLVIPPAGASRPEASRSGTEGSGTSRSGTEGPGTWLHGGEGHGASEDEMEEPPGAARARDPVRVSRAAWSYPDPTEGWEAIRDHLAFYAGRLDVCRVGEHEVRPQPGGFYGGWVTPDLAGPIKGAPGTGHW